MRTLILLLLCAAIARGNARAEDSKLANLPVEITASGDTNYENGIATAHDNVAIHVGDTDIYGDSARYDTKTHDVYVEGNVRIYRQISLFVGEKAVYNLDTKQIRAVNMRTEREPYFVTGTEVTSDAEGEYIIHDGNFTTHDSANPDFHLRARKVRIYEKDRVVFSNVTLYIGEIPIFWWPYLYQSLDDSFSFLISPAFLSSWGPSLLGQVTFPITDQIKGRVRLDYRNRRGVALGFDSEMEYGKDNSSYAKLRTYYLQDQNPQLNQTSIVRGNVPTARYRISLEDRTQFTDDIVGIVNLTKLSDPFLLEDFYQGEFRLDPQPDNVVAVTKSDPIYTLTGILRFELNSFFEQTERLPEVVLDIKRHAIFGSPIFYEGETGIANLRRTFARGSGKEDYGAVRFDTFHQLLYPNTYFGWLSIVPRVGFRATYYDRTRDIGDTVFKPSDNPLIPDFFLPDPTLAEPLQTAPGRFRTVFNTGAEASFKLSRSWENVQTRALGLDGLRHIIQPFTNFSYVSDNDANPADILQFDRFQPSTQLRPIDFPQFTSVDSIDSWTIWRVGVRNRLQTRRDDLTVSWMELETYLDVNIDNPFDRTNYSNLFNKLRFTPVPWASLVINSQVPAFDKGFSEVNTNLTFQPVSRVQFSVGHRYLNQNPFFPDSSLFVAGGYYRIDDNWGVSVQEQYEASTHVLEEQRYSIYRDLTSWVASLGAVVRDNGGVKEYGVLLTFTLKAFPKFNFDLNFDPAGANNSQ
ncbi:MAG: LPS assembly protein LptD [Chthoniobacterales bacterium]